MARTHRTADSNVERALRRQHRRDSAAHRTSRQLPTVGNPEPEWRFKPDETTLSYVDDHTLNRWTGVTS